MRAAVLVAALLAGMPIGRAETREVKLTVEPGHLLTPPFGAERVGRPWEAVVEVSGITYLDNRYVVAGYRDGKEVSRRPISLYEGDLGSATSKSEPAHRFGRVVLDDWPDEVVLWARREGQTQWSEAGRAEVKPPAFEAAAEARAENPMNPVDLGAILPPANWLLIAGGRKARVKLVARDRVRGVPGAKVGAWYDSLPDQKVTVDLPLDPSRRAEAELAMGPCSTTLSRDFLHVAVMDGTGQEIWRKDISTMIVPEPPQRPLFAAIATTLRYDQPLVRPGGKMPPYNESWDPKLQDIVIFFPNGARWVFWRGSNYCPFWAGRFNTGLSYQWAERAPASDGIGWSEPLFDPELRYGRVEIVASSESRAQARWKYQTNDSEYRGTGDSIVEDFCFYPDGFGTRTLTVTRDPAWRYQFEELIVMHPADSVLPDLLPATPLEAVSLQNEKEIITLPVKDSEPGNILDKLEQWPGKGEVPVLYRVRFDRREPLSAIGFPLTNNGRPRAVPPVYDRGAKVPPYNTLVSWPGTLDWFGEFFAHQPFRTKTVEAKDSTGKVRTMIVDTYIWLIGMSDEKDDRLLQRAASFAKPPILEVSGARAEGDLYVPERRAFRLVVEKPTVHIGIKSGGSCMNPVFEFDSAPKTLRAVRVDGKRLDASHYAWDGRTLWLDLVLDPRSGLQLEFARNDQ